MCGRYDNLIPSAAYGALFRTIRIPRSNFPPRYNIAPTDQIPIVRIDPRDGERELIMARWGLIPFWMKEKPRVPHINARAETVHKLPLFREPLRNVAASFQLPASTSGSSETMGSSHFAFAEKI
jgi:putative SOS response-associated peptidase YedK